MFILSDYLKEAKNIQKKSKEWQQSKWDKMLLQIDVYKKIAIYGGGKHTYKLLKYIRSLGKISNISCIITIEGGGMLEEIPIVKLHEAVEEYGIEVIVISSRIYEEIIYDRLCNADLQNIPIIKIYDREIDAPETERSYAYYDENGIFHSDIPMNHLQRYGWVQGYITDKIVVDMACGSGYGSSWMSERARQVIGIDISKEAIEHANKWHAADNCRFICSDITKVELDILADVVISFETIEHIQDEEGYFKTIKKILKPGGLFFVSTPIAFQDGKSELNEYHTNEYTRKRFEKALNMYFKDIVWYKQEEKGDCGISIDNSEIKSGATILAICHN